MLFQRSPRPPDMEDSPTPTLNTTTTTTIPTVSPRLKGGSRKRGPPHSSSSQPTTSVTSRDVIVGQEGVVGMVGRRQQQEKQKQQQQQQQQPWEEGEVGASSSTLRHHHHHQQQQQQGATIILPAAASGGGGVGGVPLPQCSSVPLVQNPSGFSPHWRSQSRVTMSRCSSVDLTGAHHQRASATDSHLPRLPLPSHFHSSSPNCRQLLVQQEDARGGAAAPDVPVTQPSWLAFRYIRPPEVGHDGLPVTSHKARLWSRKYSYDVYLQPAI
ncbi:uncharacterized protein LOC143277847 [Babylonia areolata]|uniref:uncharacterized protein LOC143277847 n=1 Tax=Babylonia areolata TaxID=304850 RepID=UPI003FD4112A